MIIITIAQYYWMPYDESATFEDILHILSP